VRDVVGSDILVGSVSELVSEIRGEVIGVVSDFLKAFLNGKTHVLATYTGSYSSPAIYLTLSLRTLSKTSSALFNAQELMYYIAPYDEGREAAVIIFNSPDGLGELSMLIDQLRCTGHEYAIVTPIKLPRIVYERVRKEHVVEVGEEGFWLLRVFIAIGEAVSKHLQRRGVRAERLWRELASLEPVVKDLVSCYKGVIEKVMQFLTMPSIVTATPTMWAVAEHLVYSRGIKPVRILARPSTVRNFIRFINRVLIISTDVEEYSLKEIKGLAVTAATAIEELKVRTDPLTAPIYGLILSRIIERYSEIAYRS